jgi:hypothetical protein
MTPKPKPILTMGYKNFISRLFYYLKPHVGKLVFTSAMMIFATVLEGYLTNRLCHDRIAQLL